MLGGGHGKRADIAAVKGGAGLSKGVSAPLSGAGAGSGTGMGVIDVAANKAEAKL